ncbi:CvpA family protein [Lacticaseibacillus hulanensis]|uniref:CvpA family protein n=1 Tax=Lacticaseibacillus hulanensis TaxID=2493111 RepID=UPI000FDAD227|nr:CvpA family protein [Lacticaseibacillus hulanensis]
MLSLVILIFLAYCFYIGARRGFKLQGVYTVGYIISFFIARLLAGVFRPLLELWVPYPSATPDSKFVFFTSSVGVKLDGAFYYGIAFMFVLAICWVVVHLIALTVNELQFDAISDETVNWLAGGVLNFLCGYLFMVMLLYLIALIPVDGIQTMLGNSHMAILMVRYTPVLSQLLANWWIVNA